MNIKNIKLIELFSGIGGFAKGLSDAGFNIIKHYFSEVDKHPIANYKYNFPNAEYIGSVTDISGRDFTGIDIITFGSPCQDFSLAGKREGMDGQRSVLILEAIRLVTELRPPVFIWENVKGAFSSNSGADFWGILQAFANIGGYRLEWQLLNTKWFLPQNRERIYLVGHLAGSERSLGNVFPISEDNCGINERSVETRSVRTLTAGGNSGGLHSSMTLISGLSMERTEEGKKLRKHYEAKEIDHGYNEHRIVAPRKDLLANTLDTNQKSQLIVGAIRGRNPYNTSQRIAGQYQEQVLEINGNGISNTLSTVQKDNVVIQINTSKESGGKQPYQQNRIYAKEGIAPALDQGAGRWQTNTENIRRMTEIECERLQGFPDDWTMYGNYDGVIKKVPKTQRYKMLGNAVTVKVVEEIGKRLVK